jgi:4-diphosphocytidyl-2C-methyl-D-erythritol kinase
MKCSEGGNQLNSVSQIQRHREVAVAHEISSVTACVYSNFDAASSKHDVQSHLTQLGATQKPHAYRFDVKT